MPHVQTLAEISRETTCLSLWDGREITSWDISGPPPWQRRAMTAVIDMT